ncbi:MAG: serine hydrolase domain-containing protein [Pirellulales bacterium]
MRLLFFTIGLIVLGDSAGLGAPPIPASEVNTSLAGAIREAVEAAIEEEKLPGCVVLVGAQGNVIHREAYGNRRIEPQPEQMTADTVFDLASLTKPIATATSVMVLIEQGKLRVDDPAAKHLPEFSANDKDTITIEHLLLHTGGLIADNPLADYEDGRDQAIENIYALKPVAPPGDRFIYSDVGFIVLGLVVEKITGHPLDEFARENVFEPLAMNETTFRPSEALRKRAAPADKRNGEWLVGEVHDPRAARLGGVAGHAGVFSTADDLAKYAQAMLDRGRRADRRLLSEETWQQMTRPRDLPGRGRRGLGWDIQTGYSTNRGGKLSTAAFGHGGFTGTSLWMDPEKDLFVIFLSNRLHPDGKGSVNPLAGGIADIVDEQRSPAERSRD